MSLFAAGLRLRDRFRLVHPLGAGGMSEVWRATDELLERPVAVKALATPLATDPALRAAIWKEARAAARLNHPHIAQIHDYGEVELPGGGTAGYLVMEVVNGETLADRLRAGPLPVAEAMRTAGEVAGALAAAHRLGVVHRDIKPSNVMLTESGAKVLDFGIAAVAGRFDTDPGRITGTPTYAAPERLDATTAAQPAADIYSFGVLLYEVLTGQPPVRLLDWPAAAAAHRAGVAIPTLPAGLLSVEAAALWRASLAVDPAARPDAAELAAVLTGSSARPAPAPAPGETGPTVRRYAVGAAVLPPPVAQTRLDAAPTPPGRSRLFYAGAGVTVLVVGMLAILLVTAWRSLGAEPSGAGDRPVTTESMSLTPAPALPGSPQEVINALDRALIDAAETGAITPDGFADLRDELAELREALAEPDPRERDEKLRDEAAELHEEIEELVRDGELDPSIAAELTGLLDWFGD